MNFKIGMRPQRFQREEGKGIEEEGEDRRWALPKSPWERLR